MTRRVYSFGPFQLDAGEQVLLHDGQSLPLKPKAFDVLTVLIENSGRVVHKDELMKRVWSDSFVEEGNLAVSIFEIRKVLGSRANDEPYIETVPRRGYRFVADVTETTPGTRSERGLVAAPTSLSRLGRATETDKRATLAVLPFNSIGANTKGFLGLGLAEALITKLSSLNQVTVRPISSILNYDDTQDQVSLGKTLNVDWVLDGSVQESGNRIRLTVKLVNVVDRVLWAGKFDEEFTNVFAVEDSISEQVVNVLALKLTAEDRRRIAKRPTESVEAYEAYLRAQYFYDRRTADGCKKAIQLLEQAINVDPHFALAYVGLADCYDWLRIGNVIPPAAANTKTESVILRSLELDSELAAAHTSLGLLRTRQWDWSSAQRELRKAIDLSPNDARVHSGYAILLLQLGRFKESLAEANIALKLNPLSLVLNTTLGSILFFSRKYQKAIEQSHRTLELADFPLTYVCLGYSYEAQGRYGEALKAFRRARRHLREGAELPACFARIDAVTGKREKAIKTIDELTRQPKKYCLRSNLIALIYVALGKTDDAFHWLEKAYAEHDDDLGLLKIDPRWDKLRGDPRFVSLLERVGLADQAMRKV